MPADAATVIRRRESAGKGARQKPTEPSAIGLVEYEVGH